MNTESQALLEALDYSLKLFVGQIPKINDESAFTLFFAKYGEIVEFSIIRDKSTGNHKGCAFLTYSTKESTLHAIHELNEKFIYPGCTSALQIRPADVQEREFKLFVGILPKTIDEEALTSFFSALGDLKEVHLIRTPDGKSKGCAFVKYFDNDAALRAIVNLNGRVLEPNTRPIVVKFAHRRGDTHLTTEAADIATPRVVHHNALGYIPNQEQQLYYPVSMSPHGELSTGIAGVQIPYMSYSNAPPQAHGSYPYYNPVQQVYLPTAQGYIHDTGSSLRTNSTMIDVATAAAAAAAAVAALNELLPSERYRVNGHNRAGPPTAATADSSRSLHIQESAVERRLEGPPGANLFVYHLPRDVSDADLATLFSVFGKVISSRVYVDKNTGNSKGFGFVSFDNVESASSAITSMNGFQIGSKRLKVQLKRTEEY